MAWSGGWVPPLREQIVQHDRQLQAWLRAALGRLVEVYEAQAEVFREQARRLTAGETVHATGGEVPGLEADLRELRAAGDSSARPAEGGQP